MEGSETHTEAHGFWIKQHGRQELCWQINGEFITDRALRSWIYHNNQHRGTHDQYVGTCIVQWHVDQYAARFSKEKEAL